MAKKTSSSKNKKDARWMVSQRYLSTQPTLFGLVLAGGLSKRMGKDKGLLDYHGMPQRDYVHQLLAPYCEKVYLSLRKEQALLIEHNRYNILIDKYESTSPIVGILTAHQAHPNTAWLIMACDLPKVNQEDIKQLIIERDTIKDATVFKNPTDQLPEPMLGIWESHGLKKLFDFYNEGNQSPRKFLMGNDIKLIIPKTEAISININTLKQQKEFLD